MTAHIPLALSILGAFASHYCAPTQKTAPPPPASSVTPAPAQGTANASPPLHPPLPPVPPKTSTNPNGSGAPTTRSIVPSTDTSAIHPANLCEHCQLWPKYFDGKKTHPYCSRTCANNRAIATASQTKSVSNNCEFCHSRPKYSEGTKTHDYCSKSCARNAKGPQRKLTSGDPPNRSIAAVRPEPQEPKGASTTQKAACQAPRCETPIPDGEHTGRQSTGGTQCLMCLQAPQMANSHFCSQKCNDDAESKGPVILEVPSGHIAFKNVSDQFKASWRNSETDCPPVRHVYKIIMPPASLAAYNAYKTALEAKGKFTSTGRSEGNENRRWHGTRRLCNLGDKGHTQLCSASKCSVCCIIRTSYDLSLWGKKSGWGRFGKGIYTSSTSSKSHEYSRNDCKSNLKAVLLNKVVVGKGCKLLHDSASLTAPPEGFDSVLAERGGGLSHDELVVYNNDAIRPSFLVMYEP